jgi:hypothetical protein
MTEVARDENARIFFELTTLPLLQWTNRPKRSSTRLTTFVAGGRREWDGTDIVFDIARKGDKTELRFTHVGLVPMIECYGGCSGAWGFYVSESLRSLITKGKGEPARKE